MAKEVIMPKAGMDMKEGTIIKWLVNVGDDVKEGDALLEIETDKVTMEVEAPSSGKLLCRYFEDGAVVPVVTVIAYVGASGETVPDSPSIAGIKPAAEAPKPANVQAAPEAKPVDAPVAKHSYEYDAAIIGGGPAGYVAAIRAAQLGGKVILFEKDVLGGVCLNRGCIPTKTYLKTAEHIHNIKYASSRGILVDASSLGVDMEKVHAYKQQVVGKLTGGVGVLLKSQQVTVINGLAKMAGPNQVQCEGKTYEAANIILCGGSKAGSVPIKGIENKRVVTSDEILDLTTVPRRLAIIGGGVIGCEIAIAFSAFGSEVTIIEVMDRVVPMMDAEISQAIGLALKRARIKVLCGKQVEQIADGNDAAVLQLAGGDVVEAETVLLSVGRSADTECLGNMAEKINSERGRIVVDEYCKTSVPNIYACGDLTSVSSLAHSAFVMGETAAANAMGHSEKADLSKIPSCLYTMPEAASVGLTEEEAKKTGEILVGRFPFSANGRSIASGEKDGFVKVIADKRFGEILGVHIVGGIATEMIMEAKILMDMESTIYEAAKIMYAHPTYSEALAEACNDALGKCIHLPKLK